MNIFCEKIWLKVTKSLDKNDKDFHCTNKSVDIEETIQIFWMILLGVTINLQCVLLFFLIDSIKNGNLAKYSFYWLEDKQSDVM